LPDCLSAEGVPVVTVLTRDSCYSVVFHRSGKSSIHKVVFQKMCAAETCHLPTTYRIVKDCKWYGWYVTILDSAVITLLLLLVAYLQLSMAILSRIYPYQPVPEECSNSVLLSTYDKLSVCYRLVSLSCLALDCFCPLNYLVPYSSWFASSLKTFICEISVHSLLLLLLLFTRHCHCIIIL